MSAFSGIARPPPTEIGGGDCLSFDAISLFQSCPLRFAFRYLHGLPEESVPAGLVFDSALHASVRFHFEQVMTGQPAPYVDTMLNVFRQSWDSQVGRHILFGKSESRDTYDRLAHRMLRVFRTSPVAQPAGTLLGVDEELRGSIVPGCPDLLACIHLLVDTGDALEITEFKISRGPWRKAQVAEAAGQSLLYGELARSFSGGRPVRLRIAVLTKSKRPLLRLHTVPTDPEQIARTKYVYERVWRAIQAGHFYPAPSPEQCPSCSYQQACSAWPAGITAIRRSC